MIVFHGSRRPASPHIICPMEISHSVPQEINKQAIELGLRNFECSHGLLVLLPLYGAACSFFAPFGAAPVCPIFEQAAFYNFLTLPCPPAPMEFGQQADRTGSYARHFGDGFFSQQGRHRTAHAGHLDILGVGSC